MIFIGFFDKFLIYFALRYNIQILNEENNNYILAYYCYSIASCKKAFGNEGEVNDCFETLNRATFAFNMGLDKVIFKPVSKGYRKLPSPIRTGTSNA